MLDRILERFTQEDPRNKVAKHHKIEHIMGKAIYDPLVNKHLYNRLLPPNLIKGKTVLDCGPYIFLSGAWSLYHDASFVTGVELSRKLVSIGKKTIGEFYNDTQYDLQHRTIEDLVQNDDNFYDVILIAGTIQKLPNKHDFLHWAVEHSNYIIIESNHCSMWHYLLDKPKWWNHVEKNVFDSVYQNFDKEILNELLNSKKYGAWFQNFIENKLPLHQYSINTAWSKIGGTASHTATNYTSPNFYEYFFTYKGWEYQSTHSDYLTEHMPDYYNFPHRYCVAYKKVA